MYVCLSFPLYISKLTEIARAECENTVQHRGRREENRPRGFNNNFLVLLTKERKARNQKKKTVTNLICCPCLAPGARSLRHRDGSCDVPPQDAPLLCDAGGEELPSCAVHGTQTSGFDSTTSKAKVTCASNSDCPFCDSRCFI